MQLSFIDILHLDDWTYMYKTKVSNNLLEI